MSSTITALDENRRRKTFSSLNVELVNHPVLSDDLISKLLEMIAGMFPRIQ